MKSATAALWANTGITANSGTATIYEPGSDAPAAPPDGSAYPARYGRKGRGDLGRKTCQKARAKKKVAARARRDQRRKQKGK